MDEVLASLQHVQRAGAEGASRRRPSGGRPMWPRLAEVVVGLCVVLLATMGGQVEGRFGGGWREGFRP